ncbi:Histone-lysine N-methyltransferase SUV39H2 [Chionoecetes opilio]|uniref:Histone-lysine N-methyltransferase SUV39H2 n=1 Tax=Chionoecetes opilio TaxID=41210 RepID=A0A8J5D4X5_CHIOP|nr:Histone-lysine N-methyltransferase SUV39H2 [Chionoecetes opilio]
MSSANHSSVQVKDEEAWYKEKMTSVGALALQARQQLEKVSVTHQELQEVLERYKQCVQTYKSKTYFLPQPDFGKKFGDHLKQAETEIRSIGDLLEKALGAKPEIKTSPPSSSASSSDLSRPPRHTPTPEHADIPGKSSGVAGITPPASEVGNDEILSRSLDTSGLSQRRRKGRSSSESSPKNKRLRRTLIDDYLTKKEEVKTTSEEDKEEGQEDEDEEEQEFEVQSIIDLKKIQGQYLFHVTWRGYSPDDSTWEPSSNLTSCQDLLVDFFKKKFKKRDEEAPKPEFLYSLRPFHQGHHPPGCLRVLLQDQQGRLREGHHTLFAAKVVTPLRNDVDELIEKAMTARKRYMYQKYVKMTIEDKAVRDHKNKREVQLAEMRKWERKINSICSDPAKLCVENTVDLEMPPLDFVYINDCRAGEGVTIPADPLVGCECEDCGTSKKCCANQMGSWAPYTKAGRVKVSLGTAVYECNKRCSCGPDCSNRVVQKGRLISLCIFRTPNGRGWGVKAMENIKKDSLVTEYVGEVITSEEAERRGQGYDAQRCTYLFDLDYNKGDQNPYTVDAAKFGNVSHFINHSCDPNLVVYNVWVNCLDPDLPRLALFASEDIRKGEELTFDYNSGWEAEPNALKVSEGSKEEGLSTPEKGAGSSQEVQTPLKTPKGTRGSTTARLSSSCLEIPSLPSLPCLCPGHQQAGQGDGRLWLSAQPALPGCIPGISRLAKVMGGSGCQPSLPCLAVSQVSAGWLRHQQAGQGEGRLWLSAQPALPGCVPGISRLAKVKGGSGCQPCLAVPRASQGWLRRREALVVRAFAP